MMTEKQKALLYSQPWFEKYSANVLKQEALDSYKRVIADDLSPKCALSSVIVWDYTPEGLDYWSKISSEWVKTLEKSKIIELTLEQVAEKFGVDIERLRIKD